MDKGDASKKSEKWIDAHYDPVASITSLTQCMVFSDINGDGEFKLVMADFGNYPGNIKLKVYKGTNLVTENTILDLPTGVSTFYMDTNDPRTPAIAVASGPYIYIYKNMRPYFKFTLPPFDVDPMELEVWNQYKEGRISLSGLIEYLDGLKLKSVSLTSRSLCLLSMLPSEHEAFAMSHKDTSLKKQTVITCLETLKKSMADEDAISCLVVGTESKQIYVLDPQAFTVLATMNLPAVPVFLDVSGLYDVEFTIIVACRNGGIYGLKRGSKEGHLFVKLQSQPVGVKRVSKQIVAACMDETLQCYNTKGKLLWSQKMPAGITTMEVLNHKSKNMQAVLVALTNCEIRAYVDKNHVDTLTTDDVVVAMKCGRFGREESTLVMITKCGGLVVKMLKRTATFESRSGTFGPPVAQSQKLDVPKKTKLFLDQTVRERESGKDMYRQFQHDLYRLRLETARNYVGALQKSSTPISINQADPVRLNVEVTGMGPVFKLSMHIQNTSSSQPSVDLCIMFDSDSRLYGIQKPYIAIPMLVPGVEYVFETIVQCLSDKGISDVIKVFVLKKNTSTPIITAVVNMPVSEPTLG